MIKDYTPRVGMGVIGRRTDTVKVIGYAGTDANGGSVVERDYRKAKKVAVNGKLTPQFAKVYG